VEDARRRAAGLSALDPFRTMQQAIEAQVRSPYLRDLLLRYATYNGSDPRRAPATLNCIAHVELAMGCWGVRGGLYALVEALVTVAERLGVQVQTGQPVERILTHRRRVTGVRTADGRTLSADAVIANADVAHVVTDLLAGQRHRLKAKGAPSTSGYTAIVRQRGTASPAAPHEVLFPSPYREEFADLFDRQRAPREPPSTCATRASPTTCRCGSRPPARS